MRSVDTSPEAVEYVKVRTIQYRTKMSADAAMDAAHADWMKSLRRAQLIKIHEDELRANAKPTLHVNLFEAAKRR